jgi:hypothetical protein
MDPKERFILADLHTKIISGSFTERDVLELFIILRDHAKKDSLVAEFGHFVAHRERNQGKLKTVIENFQSNLDNRTVGGIQVITQAEIHKSLNEILQDLRLPEISVEVANQIMVCIISILQSAMIKIKRASGVVDVELSVEISMQYIYLFGKAYLPTSWYKFPVLMADNDSYILTDFQEPQQLNELIEIRFSKNHCDYDYHGKIH